MHNRRQLLESLVDHAYQAMLDSVEWPAFLAKFADSINGTLPMLFVHDAHARGTIYLNVGYDAEAIRDFHAHYAERNVWLRGAARKRLLTVGKVRTSHMMCSRREFLRSEWYAGWCRPLNISQAIGTTILKNATSMFNVTIMRGNQGELGPDEIALVEAMMPHLQRALKVHMRLAEGEVRRRGLTEALDGLAVAVILVGDEGRVLYMNREAERLVVASDGLAIDTNRLKAARSHETARLKVLIGTALETSARRGLHGGGVMRIARPSGRRAFELLVSPIRADDAPPAFEQPIALVYVSDPAQAAQTSGSVLRELYGLTAAEARVATLSAQGMSNGKIADKLGVSPNTVKTQLKRVFSKTNTTRQAELIQVVSHGAARAKAPAPT